MKPGFALLVAASILTLTSVAAALPPLPSMACPVISPDDAPKLDGEVNEAVWRKASAQHRRDIAELKRQIQQLKKAIGSLERQEKKRLAEQPATKKPEGARFSAKGVKAQRERLGLSAKKYGQLVGVSEMTIYNWEAGKSKPQAKQLAALVAVRGLGKREAVKRLEMVG